MADFNALWEPINEPNTPSQVLSGELSWLRHLVVPGTVPGPTQSSGQLHERTVDWGRVPLLQQPIESQPLPKKPKLVEPEPLPNVVELGDKTYSSGDCVYREELASHCKPEIPLHCKPDIPLHPDVKPVTADDSEYRPPEQASQTKPPKQKAASEKLYICEVCGYKTARSGHMKVHKMTHTGEKPFGCDQCGFRTPSKSQLKDHMRIHTGEKPYACDQCDYRAARGSHLKNHKMTHTGEKPFGCDQCEFRTAVRHRLIHHIKCHTGEKPYACDVCEFRTAVPNYLKQHKRTHTGEKPYACDQCEFRSSYAQGLKNHKMLHAGETRHKAPSVEDRRFICEECGYRTATATYLTIHKRTHTGEKPFACDQCDYRSVEACTLRRHKRLHTGEKPFVCDECDHKFSRATALKNHKRKHTGEKPFACDECDYRTAWPGQVAVHKRIHSKEYQEKKERLSKQGRKKKPYKKKPKKAKPDDNGSSEDEELDDDDAWDYPDMPSSDEGDGDIGHKFEENNEAVEDKQFATSDELLVKIHDFIKKELLLTEVRDDKVYIFKLDTEPHLRVKYSITINKDFDVTVVHSGVELKELPGFKFPYRSTNVAEIQSILSRLEQATSESESSASEKTTVITKLLSSLASDDNGNQIQFLKEQITLITKSKNNYRYSPETMAFFSILYTISPHSYKYLRRSQYLKMPHPIAIGDLCSTTQCDEQQSFLKEMGLNGFNYEPFLKYAKKVFPFTTEHDKTVVILMDEVQIKPCLDLKAGQMVDLAQDSPNLATTAHTFMISSVRSAFKEVVHIMPVHSFTAEKLHNVLKNLIIGLEKIGFIVVGIVSDNLSLHCKAVSHFSNPPKLSIAYLHPCEKSRPLFYVIDTVQITKRLRNEWIDSSTKQTIAYPKFQFDDGNAFASFSVIKRLFENESEPREKQDCPLTVKALYPSSVDRQNVKYILQVFNTFIIEGLNMLHDVDTNGSLEFIKIISEWCKVVDVTLSQETRYKNEVQKLIKLQESGMKFLDDTLNWLDRWDKLATNDADITFKCPTLETISNFKHSAYAIIEITRYCIEELKFEHFLPGKLQIDALERRFGQYRQPPGPLLRLSMSQIRDFERRLGLRHFCLLIKVKINVEIHNIGNGGNDYLDNELTSKTNLIVDVVDSDLRNVREILPILLYISGYSSDQMSPLYGDCHSCKSVFVLDTRLPESNSCALITSLSKGGLHHPQDFSLTVTAYCYIVFSKILRNSELKAEFSKSDIYNQRSILLNVVLEALYRRDILADGDCGKGHSIVEKTKIFIRTVFNTLMNIYRWAPNKTKKEVIKKQVKTSSSKASKGKRPKLILKLTKPKKTTTQTIASEVVNRPKTRGKINKPLIESDTMDSSDSERIEQKLPPKKYKHKTKKQKAKMIDSD